MKMEQGDTIQNTPLHHSRCAQLDDSVVLITKIRAMDVATSLRRVPVWFYASVLIEDEEYRTIKKHVSLDSRTIEWTDHFCLPTDPSTTIHLRVYASFELGPMLGRGEQLGRFSISVRDLIDRINDAYPTVSLPKDGGSVASCSSLEVSACTRSSADLTLVVLSPRVVAGSDEERYWHLATDAGHSHMLRYYREPQEIHLDRAITQFEKVVDRCPENHSCRGAALSNLALAKTISCLNRGAYPDLDLPIALYRQALDRYPNNHPDHTFTLINLANALLLRFDKQAYNADADEAEELLAKILDMCPANSYEHQSALLVVQTFISHNTADSVVGSNAAPQESSAPSTHLQPPYSLVQLDDMLEECEQRDDPELLDSVVSGYRDAEVQYVAGQPDWIEVQLDLAMALHMRFRRKGQEQDIDEAIQRNQDVSVWIPVGHPHRSQLLHSLAITLTVRFEQLGDHNDLDEAIQHFRDVLPLRPTGHPDRSSTLNNLATTLRTRFEQSGDCDDLDEAIRHHRDALLLTPVGHSHRSESLNDLASTLTTRFEQLGDHNDLDEAIRHHRDALSLRPVGHLDRLSSLNNLASVLVTRFGQRGEHRDLDEAIRLFRDALLLRPTEHIHRYKHLNNIANALTIRFQQQGNHCDLDEAIQHFHDALSCIPIGHSRRSLCLDNLAIALRTRFEQRGDHNDLDNAIEHHRDALLLTPVGHSGRSMCLNNFAIALATRFEQRGDHTDLDEAIHHHSDALLLRPIGHPDRWMTLNNLAITLRTRFEQQGDHNDLGQAIQHFSDALSLRPTGHPGYSMSLNNLATALITRFEQQGDQDDLDEAILHHRGALLLRPNGHSDRPTSLNNLAVALITRFEQRGDRNDLDEAIKHHNDAVSLTPIGHSQRSMTLSNLAFALTTRFEQRGDHHDLDNAIEHHRDALSLRPIGHSDRSSSLINLANVLARQSEQRGDHDDLDEAIQHHRDALLLLPTGHSHHSVALHDLASTLMTRFEQRANNTDITEALRLCRVAGNETPASHPTQLSIYRMSASIHLVLWKTSNIAAHLHSAMAHYRAAGDIEPAGLLSRLQSCLSWVQSAEQHGHESSLEAYAKSLQLLDAHVSAAASVSDRHPTMKHFPTSLSVDAASCALCHGNVPHALELLEQGRVLLWNQLTRFRTSLDDLSTHNVHTKLLVERFQDLSLQLSRQPTGESEPPADDFPKAALEAEANHYRRLVVEWNKVVGEIRTLDGFSRFLLPPLFSDLQEAASEGPVIILVASKFSCDAIIVLYDLPPVHIVLDITLQRLAELAGQLRKKTYLSDDSQRSAVAVLRQLWDTVMLPIISKLEEFIERGSRIWWCPTSIFTAFPLHAVGEYRKTSKRSVAAYISSYTPSLSALIKARKTKFASSPVHFAAIGQALPDGHQVPLECVDRELDEIERLLPSSSIIFTKLPSTASTKQQALHALLNNPWIHFSCHGTQNFDEPFKSHLSMRDGPLSLLDIINSNLSKHEFAFLSACKTAVGDFETLDEAIHLAAGLQFMGVKSVIGTLWSVDDEIAYRVVAKFYQRFCSGEGMDPSRAARALHHAILSLARDKVALEDRMLFIHIGI